ncbi:MAG TPA: hypothetical protein GX713_00310 [Mollicutes bacterium]|nr:hypothetical protein [Mollicutes bacterium]
MKLKITTFVILLLCISIVVGLAFIMKGSDNETLSMLNYTASGTITERRSGKKVIITLDDDSVNKLVDNLEIHSNIFMVGDRLNIKYHFEKNKYVLNELEPILRSDTERNNLANKISSDPTMIRYQEKMKRDKEIEDNTLAEIVAIPDIIKGQTYLLLKPEEYFKIKNYNYRSDTIVKEEETIIRCDESFTVFSFENYFDEAYTKVDYEYVDGFEKDAIVFKGLNKGIYILKVAYKNGDMINYVFI